MSIVAQDHVFLSALQPKTAVSTYAVPSEIQLGGNGATLSDEMTRGKRVQQQVAMRLAEKSSTLPRQNGSASHYTSSEHGGSSTMKYQTFNPGFSSKSYVYTGSRPVMAPNMSQYSGGFSSHSAVDLGGGQRVTMGGGGRGGGGRGGGGGGGGGYTYLDDMRTGGGSLGGGGYQGGVVYRGGGGGNMRGQQMSTVIRTMSRGPGPDPEASLRSMRLQNLPAQPSPVAAWVAADVSDGCSLVSDRDATFSRQQSVYSTVSGGAYSSGTQMRQAGGGGIGGQGSMVPMRRSLSGTLAQSGGEMMGGEEMMSVQQQHSFKGPAFRTINRINNRNNRMSMGSTSGSSTFPPGGNSSGGDGGGGFVMGQVSSGSQGNLMTMQQQRQASLPRTMSVKSIHSVGKGMDIYDGPMGMTGSMGNLSGINNLDMGTAVRYLKEDDADMQVLGAAYIQHECYNNSDSKNQVRQYKAIPELVRLFNSENQEVARYATGAMRNVIYENMDNKMSLIEEGGIPQLINALKENDDELRKNITGILWNLSSKDNLKEKLAKETLAELTETILIPLSGSGDTEVIQQSPSEVDIFYNTTGCLRNLSSVNEKTRRQMRETNGLVDALVGYIQASVQDGKVEEKGVENSLCVLRNLSYQLYSEIPPSAQLRLEGPTRGQETSRSEAIGCFTPQSKKVKDRKNQDMATFTEVARVPKGLEWLWHPQVVGLYNSVLQGCENNSTTREAAAGALQNITAGDKRWAEVLSHVALEQERMLPVMLDKLRTNNDLELKSLTGFLRNLSRHAKDKNAMATKVVNNLVTELPADGQQKEPSSDVVVNICGTLNNLVTSSSIAARDIAFFDGLQKLVAIKNSHDSSPGKLKASKAAATVLSNMFQYKKLHKDYKQKGFTRPDFADVTI
ncbi:plakophilin-3 isoform X1 [Oncorhynchus mykiss]|uniref:plakophilin-3 isoform X1 n=1 Tax=Oncorhynchus mykiss TaxID=8022 RepID=UPI001878021D|nr:plakophilin-3 isoform X1 [Oncorhynchus mykiss]